MFENFFWDFKYTKSKMIYYYYKTAFFSILLLFLCGIAVLIISLRVKRLTKEEKVILKPQMEQYFSGRPELTSDEFYGMYYKDSGISRENIHSILESLEGNIGEWHPVKKFIPSDKIADLLDFDVYTDPLFYDHYSYIFYSISLHEKYKSLSSDRQKEIEEEFFSLETIDDFIKFIYKRLPEYGIPPEAATEL